jgi:hypothetical protein
LKDALPNPMCTLPALSARYSTLPPLKSRTAWRQVWVGGWVDGWGAEVGVQRGSTGRGQQRISRWLWGWAGLGASFGEHGASRAARCCTAGSSSSSSRRCGGCRSTTP